MSAGDFKFFFRSFLLVTRVLLKLIFIFNFFLDVSSSSRMVRAFLARDCKYSIVLWIIRL